MEELAHTKTLARMRWMQCRSRNWARNNAGKTSCVWGVAAVVVGAPLLPLREAVVVVEVCQTVASHAAHAATTAVGLQLEFRHSVQLMLAA